MWGTKGSPTCENSDAGDQCQCRSRWRRTRESNRELLRHFTSEARAQKYERLISVLVVASPSGASLALLHSMVMSVYQVNRPGLTRTDPARFACSLLTKAGVCLAATKLAYGIICNVTVATLLTAAPA